jgi:predicted RNA-binding protein
MERPRHRWEYNIEMDVRETGYEDMLWTEVTPDKLQLWDIINLVKNFVVL